MFHVTFEIRDGIDGGDEGGKVIATLYLPGGPRKERIGEWWPDDEKKRAALFEKMVELGRDMLRREHSYLLRLGDYRPSP